LSFDFLIANMNAFGAANWRQATRIGSVLCIWIELLIVVSFVERDHAFLNPWGAGVPILAHLLGIHRLFLPPAAKTRLWAITNFSI
jgi:hypothetical protein